MALSKIQAESMNLADTYAFTGSVSGAGGVNTPAFYAVMSGANQTGMSPNTNTKVQFSSAVYDSNSMQFNIYSLNDSQLITQNVDLEIKSDSITYDESFTGGVLNKTNMLPGTYTITAESSGYITTQLIASINDTYQQVDIYLNDNSLQLLKPPTLQV